MAPPLPVLPDELVEGVLLRTPPDDPATLVRAAAACHRWRRLVADPGFRRRFCEFHRTPPLLGVFCHNRASSGSTFVPTSPSCPPIADRTNLYVINARHGRVLLSSRMPWDLDKNYLQSAFVVWDPTTDHQIKELPLLPGSMVSWKAAVLCAGSLDGSCVHLDCRRGPFLVFLVGTTRSYNNVWRRCAHIYSSENGAWSEPIFIDPDTAHRHKSVPWEWQHSVVVGNVLYFMLRWSNDILNCNLSTREMSFLKAPQSCLPDSCFLMTTTVDDRLGVGSLMQSKLHLFSMEVDPDGHEAWALNRVIELQSLVPMGVDTRFLDIVTSAEGLPIIFMYTLDGVLLAFDLKSKKFTTVCKGSHHRSIIYPYMSFYIPAPPRASIGERPAAGTSSSS